MKDKDLIYSLIVETINAGLCKDVVDRIDSIDPETRKYIESSTEDYDLVKTLEFIKESIIFRNNASGQHFQKA